MAKGWNKSYLSIFTRLFYNLREKFEFIIYPKTNLLAHIKLLKPLNTFLIQFNFTENFLVSIR